MLEFILNKIIDKNYKQNNKVKQLEKLQKKLNRLSESLILREEETIYKLEDLGLLKIEIFRKTLKKFKNNYSKIKNINEKQIYLSDFLKIDINEELNIEETFDYALEISEKGNSLLNTDKSLIKKLFFSPIINMIEQTNNLINVKKNIKEIEAAISNIEDKLTALQIYYDFATDIIINLKKLKSITDEYNEKMEKIIKKSTNYQNYSKKEKEIIAITTALKLTLKNICTAPMISNNQLSNDLKKHLKDSDELIKKIKDINEQ